MVKKRIIFTLLFAEGYFMLSRNFRLQKVGDIQWLNQHYNFENIAVSIDELLVLDVSRNEKDGRRFCDHLKMLGEQCFVPIAAGGGIRCAADADRLLKSGADKIVVNTILHTDKFLVKDLVSTYGSQCVIGSVDLKRKGEHWKAFIKNGSEEVELPVAEYLRQSSLLGVGEIYLNSMERDGTGQGYLLEMMGEVDGSIRTPIILAGGAGNYQHFLEGLQQRNVDAVATAHLFNFVSDGLSRARELLLEKNMKLAFWSRDSFADLKS